MDPRKLSALIRAKKMKLLNSDPEVGSSEPAMMNAQDVEDNKQLGRIETTLDVPEKEMQDESDLSEADAKTAGLTPEEKTRMARLRSYIDTLDVA